MEKDTLDHLARALGRVYDGMLRGSKVCNVERCKHRRADGSCDRVDEVRDVVDRVWEAKDGRPERLDALLAKIDAERREN